MRREIIDNNPILKLTIEFSLMIISYCEELRQTNKIVVSNQLVRSGTSIGANCFEAQNGESKADFIHKIKIAAKEADETQYWLLICDASDSYPKCDNLSYKLIEIQKVLNKIISTSKSVQT